MVFQDRGHQLRPCQTIILISWHFHKAMGVVLERAKQLVAAKAVMTLLLGHLVRNIQCIKTPTKIPSKNPSKNSRLLMFHAASPCTQCRMSRGRKVRIILLLQGLVQDIILVNLPCGICRPFRTCSSILTPGGAKAINRTLDLDCH